MDVVTETSSSKCAMKFKVDFEEFKHL